MRSRLNPLLYLISVCTDFAAFIVVFTVSRQLAEEHQPPWYLGVVGAVAMILSTGACAVIDVQSTWLLPGYWTLGVGLGFLYPPLIGWLNQHEDAHTNRRGVSRTLILFCVAWNAGMMCGQLTAGSLFAWGPRWAYGAAFTIAAVNLPLALIAVRRVVPYVTSSEGASAVPHADLEIATAFKRLSWIANLGSMFGGSLVIHLLPDLAVTIGIRPENHGALLAGWRAAIIATYLLLHHAAFWHYRLSTSIASQLLAAAGLVVISQAHSAPTLLIGLVLLGQLVGYNYFSGLYYSTAGSANTGRALAAGIHEATLAAGMAIGTITGGVLGTLVNHRVPYLMAAAAMVVLIVIQSAAWMKWVRPLHRLRTAVRPDE
jgi:MFS family permease